MVSCNRTIDLGETMGASNPTLRTLNVVLAPGSPAHRAIAPPAPAPTDEARSGDLAPGFSPQPSWNLVDNGGPTIAELTFINCYVGAAGEWAAGDMSNIDSALSAAMSDAGLESVVEQYFAGESVTSTMLPSIQHHVNLPGTVYKDFAEHVAKSLQHAGVLGNADPSRSVINIMLPKGIVLSDDFSPGSAADGREEAEKRERRSRGVIKIDPDDAASSKAGLGGYHGGIHLAGGTRCYYAVGVYSEGDNGIVAFDEPWKNVVATFYHELVEARTDAAVEDVNATGNGKLLGWYSDAGQGEIGDLPINASGGDLSLVFKEVPLADGSGTVPIQLMWSNAASGPAAADHAHAGQAAV
jgi:hypothetical protein